MTNFKLNNPASKKRRILLPLVAVVLIAGALLTFWYVNKEISDTPEPTTAEANKQAAEEYTDESEDAPPESKQSENPSMPDQVADAAVVKITENISQDTNIKVTALASGITPTNCVFTFSYTDSRPVTKRVDAVGQKCGPVEVPYLEFDRTGAWNLSVTAYNQDSRATTEGNVEIR
jgi:cytoskeletal protein RodZ